MGDVRSARWRRRGLEAEIVEKFAAKFGLISREIPLKSKPSARHFHLQKPGKTGTLEITLDGGKLTYAIRASRKGDWMDDGLIAALVSEGTL